MAEKLSDLTPEEIAALLKEMEERKKSMEEEIARAQAVQQEKKDHAARMLQILNGDAATLPSLRKTALRVAPVARKVTRMATTAPNVFAPKPGTLDEKLFDALIPLPQQAEKVAAMIKQPAGEVAARLEALELEKIVGHFDIERRKPTKHKGVSTPVIERYFFWRPRAELEPKDRRTIMTGLLMRKWWSNHDLVEAAKARTAPEIRAVDNMVRTLRRAENVWHKQGEDGRWLYWISEDRAEPSKEMDGRDWGEKSIHARRAKLKGPKK